MSDSQTSGPVSITLSAPIVENGIRLLEFADGMSTPAVIENKECYRFMPKGNSFMYFVISPSFKRPQPMNVELEVEYFDAANGILDVQYDSWSQGPQQGRFRLGRQKASLNRSRQWKRVIIYLPEARFENRQNGAADFRLRASRPEVYVRQVTARHVEMAIVEGPYTYSNSVSLVFDEPLISHGLRQALDPDSVTASNSVAGQSCLAVSLGPNNSGYVYFIIDDSFKAAAEASYGIDVEYYSAEASRFRIEYDGHGGGQSPNPEYSRSIIVEDAGGSWEKATFNIPNPRFRNSQNGRADFRLQIFTPNFFVRSVTVRRQGG